jgi:GNAT superfamily N-acetyltransferase
MNQLTFRLAREADFESLLELLHELHANDTPASEAKLNMVWKEIIKNDGIRHYLAEVAMVPIAVCHLVVVPNLTRGARPYGVIENVVTKKEFRRQGVGTRLLRHVLKEAWALNCYKVMLMTGSRQQAVHQFYEKAGFKPGLKTAFVAKPEQDSGTI